MSIRAAAARPRVIAGVPPGPIVVDALAWPVGLALAALLHSEPGVAAIDTPRLAALATLAAVLSVAAGAAVVLHGGRVLTGTIDDVLRVARVDLTIGAVLVGAALAGVIVMPLTVPVLGTLVAVAMSLAVRTTLRLGREHRVRPDPGTARRVVVFGAGFGGQQVVRAMLTDPDSEHVPVALLDDDPAAQGRRISGVPVRGTRADIVEVAEAGGADLLVVAVHDLDVAVTREIGRTATQAGIQVKVVPAITDVLGASSDFSELRDLDIADLLGRSPVEVDVDSIAGYLSGRRVLVTGAGGSIGSELCRQVHQYQPGELIMLDRDESALHALQLSIYGTALLDSPDVVLADIRDAATIREIFLHRRPDVVFHAAALKHLPMLEQYPHEAWQTNVLGTAAVLDAAVAAGVQTFVNVSTDKAANPVSVLGRSKRIGERLVAHTALQTPGRYVSVRFGNVLGSRGSVLTTFAEQIAADLPVTVTHPDVTRFFMTIPEAVRLVVQAAAIGEPGEALVLDMGTPVRIVDVARQLTALAGRPVQILYTGLRDGEKLHEELFGDGEQDVRRVHPAVSHVAVPALDSSQLLRDVDGRSAGDAMKVLVDADTAMWPDLPTSVPEPRQIQAGHDHGPAPANAG